MKSTPPLFTESKNIEDDDVWNIIEAFFKEYGFISHHLESYNTFIEYDIPRIVEGKILTVDVDGMKCTVEFVNVFLEKPVHRQINEELITIYPKQCVDRDISYLSNIYCDIEFTNQYGIKKIYESIHIGAVPVMAKSHLCNLYEISEDKEALAKLEENFYDPGGYFIINGAKKILCNEERTIYNKIYVFVNRKTNPKYDIYAEVRSIGFSGSHNTTTCVGLFHKKNTIGVVIPYIETSELPIGVIFRALGAKSEEEIIRFIFGSDSTDEEGLKLILHSLEYSYECSTRDAALHFIGKSGKKFTGSHANPICEEEEIFEFEKLSQVKKDTISHAKHLVEQVKKDAISYAKHLIENEFLPHVGTDESYNTQKMFYLGIMVKKLIDVKLKRREPDDRDHEAIKRRLTAGIRMANLFNNAFKRLCSEIVSSIDRFMRGNNAVEIKSTIKAKTIKSAMCNAISNNAWGGRGKTPGISQEYDCFNYQSLLANARKDRSPVTAEGGKVEKPRQVHGTHWGNECMSDTPEGKQAGLVKNKAMGQLVTTGSDHFSILEIIKNMNIISFEEMHSHQDFFSLPKIFLNGYPVGVTRFPENVQSELLHLRRSCSIHPEVSISFDRTNKEIYIMTDAGRTCRPLLIVENGSLKLKKEHILSIQRGEWDEPPGNTWSKLLSRGFVEIVDKQEEEFATIVMFPSELENHPLPHTVTHCELHPTMAFGVGVNTVPFPDHNQCIFEHELVYMADGTTKKIKDVLVGDRVINFDPSTHIQTNTTVVSTFLGPTNKRVYDVTTFSGRCIRATYDHRFMTNKGWMKLEDIPTFSFDKDEKSVSPLAQKSDLYKSFFSAEEIASINHKPIMVAVSVEPNPLPHTLDKISIPLPLQKIKDLLPEEDIEIYGETFIFQDSLHAVRARVVGYGLSPKSKIRICSTGVSKTCVFVSKFRNYTDAIAFIEDLKILGYYSSSLEVLREDCVEVTNKNLPFILFMISCGVEILGKKDRHVLPTFIKEGSLLLKREFLAGYHGGSMHKTLFHFDPCTCDVVVDFPDNIILSTSEHSLANQKFRDELTDLLDDFDILLYVTGKENAYTYRMLSDMDNVIDYSRKIGFRYNRMQSMDLGTISEYYKAKRLEYFTGTFEKWNNTIDVSPMGRSIFVPLFKKEILREDVFIADITTLSSFQSFICGDGFCVHNSPRNTYQSSMGKQAVGIPGSNYMFKTKGNFHVMKYHQKPIVSTKMANIMGFQHQPSGLNAVVFIGTYLGLNQEDSVVINQDSIDRGFMVSTAYLPVDAKIRKDKGEAFEIPSEMECSNFIGNVSKLDPLTGIVREGEYVQDGDILIGKTVTIDEEFSIYSKKKKNLSVRYQGWPGIVHLIQRGIDGQGYEYVRVVVAQERSPIDGDKFCYTPDHDVLTEKGWKNITELEYSDKIATLNEQHEIEYHNPTNIVSFDHDGDVIEIDTNQVSLCVTPNHNLYVKRRGRKEYKLEEAGKLYNIHLHFKKNGKNTNPDQSTFCLNTAWRYVGTSQKHCIIYPPINVDMDAWLMFYGIWYAEGCVSNNRLCIAINKERVLNKLKELSESLDFNYTISGYTMYVKDIHIRFHLKKLSVGAIHKKLEDWVWSLSERQSRILLEGLLLGDGHDNGGTPMYDTSSVQLKDDVMRLALHCGWSANAYVRFPKEKKRVIRGCDTKMNADSWRITIVKKQNEPAINEHIKNQLTKTNYKGKVYCCTVPNNVLYVRRNVFRTSFSLSDTLLEGKTKFEFIQRLEKPLWCGNSASPGQKSTIGHRPRSHELPFNKYGIAPDVMINPLAMPSRMTIGLLIEMICGKMVCSTSKLHKIEVGQVFRLDKKDYSNPTDDITHSDISSSSNIDIEDTSRSEEMHSIATEEYKKIVSVYDEKIDEKLLKGQDATPWQPSFKIEDICAELKKLGMNEFSAERMTFGKTGEVQEYLMYEGVCYYQRLKHMVVDKHHARSRGGRVRITHQPLEFFFQAVLRL